MCNDTRYTEAVPLRSPRRIPRKYNRPVSQRTKQIAAKRTQNRKKLKREKWKRSLRRIQQTYKLWRKWVMKWLLAGLLSVVTLILALLLFSPLLNLQEISVQRSDPRLDIERVQSTLSPLFGRHMLFVSQFEVLSLLREEFADLETVHIQKVYPSQLQVQIHIQPLIAELDIVRSDTPDIVETSTGARIDYLTSGGIYVNLTVPPDDDLPQIRIVDWGAHPSPGQLLVAADILERINVLQNILEEQFGHSIEHRTLYMRAQEIHMHTPAYTLWFDMRGTVDDQIGRYKTFLENVSPEEVEQYIDLRIGDRVVYK